MTKAAYSHAGSSARYAPIAVMVAAVLQILTPVLPALGIGEPIGSQSDAVRTVITPAGWAFSIWGALYTGSLLFAIYQLLPAQRNNALLERIRWPAAGAFLGNALWAAYTQVFGLTALSVAIIAATLCCLIAIYRSFTRQSFATGERWLVYLPLSALTAWLTVATTVNIAASLRYHGVEAGEAAPAVGAGILVVAGIIAAIVLVRGRGNLPYAGVFLWALAAIYAAGGQVASLITLGTGIAVILVLAGLFMGLRADRRASPFRD